MYRNNVSFNDIKMIQEVDSCEFLQQLQGVKTIKHPFGKVRDLVSIKDTKKTQNIIKYKNISQLKACADFEQTGVKPLTESWESEGPGRRRERFLKSGCCSGH